jgi:hypothetical protein
MDTLMAKLSKTARASMGKVVKEKHVETPEESLRQLRLDLAAGLYVPAHRIKMLLDLYDTLKSYVDPASQLPENPDHYGLDRPQR